MKKSLIALLLVVALVVTVSVFAASAEATDIDFSSGATVVAPCEHCGITNAEWKPFNMANLATGHYYLADASLTEDTVSGLGKIYNVSGSQLNPQNVEICLHLNGNTLYRSGGGAMSLTGSTLAIMDHEANEGKFRGRPWTSVAGGCIAADANSEVYVYGGTVQPVLESGRAYALYGGCINSAGYVEINGGTLTGGAATRGGAIYISGNGQLVVKDGVIENSYATNRAGAIMVTGANASLEMSGGRISNCFIMNGSTTEFGGNIYVEYADATISGGIIENGGIAPTGSTVTADTEHDGGNICMRGNNAELIVKDDAIIRGGKGLTGGNIFLDNGDLTIKGGTISGGQATGNGGNIQMSSPGKLTVNADEGKTVKITGGSARVGGNIAIANANSTTNITGPDVTISGGSGIGRNIRVGAAKEVNLTDVSVVGATVHGDNISLGGGSKIKLCGATNADKIQIETDSNSNMVSTQITIAEGYTGTSYIGWSHVATTAAITAGAPTHHSLWQEAGYTGTGEIFVLDSTTSGKILLDTGDAVDTDNKFVVAGFAGVKVDADGELNLTPIGGLEEAAGYDFVRPYFNSPITLVDDLNLDLNNSTLHVITGEHKLNLIEMRTNTFADAGDAKEGYVRGYVTVDNEANVNTIVREQATGNQYIVVPTGETEEGLTKFTAHRVQVDIDSVNIKPATAGLYYTTNMDTTPTASKFAMSYGVVLSLVDMPGADFLKDDSNQDENVDNLYTEIDFEEDIERVAIKGANSALLVGILNQGAPEGQNDAWGTKPIFANAYVCFNIDGKDYYVMADETYELSLKGIMELVDDNEDLASHASVVKMYGTWQDPLAQWGLDNIKAAYDAANA